MRKCTLDQEEESQLESSFGHFSQTWYYLHNFQTAGSPTLPKVRRKLSSKLSVYEDLSLGEISLKSQTEFPPISLTSVCTV